MGNKVHPTVFRLGTVTGWESKWYARGRAYADNLRVDILLKKYVSKELKAAGVARVEIERTHNAISVIIFCANPGSVIGRQGAGAEDMKRKLKQQFFASQKVTLHLNIIEVSRPGLSAQLVTQGIVSDIEKRMPFRRAMKQAIERVQKAGAQGVKIMISGRLNGAEIARTEKLSWGKIPLHTIRADIDYGRAPATTVYGVIGVKVWVYRGEVFTESEQRS